jgi:hypothetical protein
MNQNWFDCCPQSWGCTPIYGKDWRIRWKSHGSHGWVAPAPRPARNTISQSTQPESWMSWVHDVHDDWDVHHPGNFMNVWNVWNEDDTKTCWIDLKILKHPADSVVLLFSGWGPREHPKGLPPQRSKHHRLVSWQLMVPDLGGKLHEWIPQIRWFTIIFTLEKTIWDSFGWILFWDPIWKMFLVKFHFLWNFIEPPF